MRVTGSLKEKEAACSGYTLGLSYSIDDMRSALPPCGASVGVHPPLVIETWQRIPMQVESLASAPSGVGSAGCAAGVGI